jgi:transposase
MTNPESDVIGGVDTHKYAHHAAVIDGNGRLLGAKEFTSDDRGQEALLAWMRSHGTVRVIGVEGTGFYGASLARFLVAEGQRVVEVNRPNHSARRADGKSDRLDAEQVARAVLAKTATSVPKAKSGPIEVIRILRVTRAGAVKSRTQAFLSLHGLLIGAPSPLRDELVKLSKRTLVNRCLRLRPETEDLIELAGDSDRMLLAGVKRCLRDLARRWKVLDEEVTNLSLQIKALVEQTAPELADLFGVGAEIAGQFPGHRRRQPRPHSQRGCLRQALWGSSSARQQRPDQRPPPPESQRRSGSQQRALHSHARPVAPPCPDPHLPRETERRGPQQAGDHPLP